jgi:ketosteroid isomerase-like protein
MQHAEIREFIHRYCEAFRPGNIEAVAQYFHYPTILLSDGMSIPLLDAKALSAALGVALSALADNGFAYSQPQQLHIHGLTNETAIVSARYNRCRADGSLLEEIAATYTLLKTAEQGWKIVTIITHDRDNLISANL